MQLEAFPGAKPWYLRAVIPTWQWDQLYQHSLDCVILAWDSCPFSTPCLHVLPEGPDQTCICELIWVKRKYKGGMAIFTRLRELPRLEWWGRGTGRILDVMSPLGTTLPTSAIPSHTHRGAGQRTLF